MNGLLKSPSANSPAMSLRCVRMAFAVRRVLRIVGFDLNEAAAGRQSEMMRGRILIDPIVTAPRLFNSASFLIWARCASCVMPGGIA